MGRLSLQREKRSRAIGYLGGPTNARIVLTMTPAQTIEKFFEGTPFLVRGKSYHSELPPIVRDWYCYTSDGGHSILSLIEGQFDYAQPDLWQKLCPVPVRHVLRGYRIHAGYPVVQAKYDSEIGLQTNPEDDEF